MHLPIIEYIYADWCIWINFSNFMKVYSCREMDCEQVREGKFPKVHGTIDVSGNAELPNQNVLA